MGARRKQPAPSRDGLAQGQAGPPGAGMGDDQLQSRDLLPMPDPACEVTAKGARPGRPLQCAATFKASAY